MNDAGPRRGLPWSEIRPALIALVVVGGGWWFLSSRMPAPGARLEFRDEGPLRLTGPVPGDSGATLSWNAIAGAERYVLVFSGRELQELARVSVQGDTTLVLRGEALPGALVAGTQAFVAVTALRGDSELARSRGRTIQVP